MCDEYPDRPIFGWNHIIRGGGSRPCILTSFCLLLPSLWAQGRAHGLRHGRPLPSILICLSWARAPLSFSSGYHDVQTDFEPVECMQGARGGGVGSLQAQADHDATRAAIGPPRSLGPAVLPGRDLGEAIELGCKQEGRLCGQLQLSQVPPNVPSGVLVVLN